MYSVKDTEITILNNEHKLIHNAEEYVHKAGSYQLASSFLAAEEWKDEYDINIPNHRPYPILKNKRNLSTIKADYIIDFAGYGSGHISLIILQGERYASVKLQHKKQWHRALSIPVSEQATSIISLEVAWDKDGAEELTLLAIPSGGLPMKDVLTPIRIVAIRDELQITPKMINEQGFNLKMLDMNNLGGYLLKPSLLNEEGRLLEDINASSDRGSFSARRITSIRFNELPYNTNVDIIYFNDLGDVVSLIEGLELSKNEATTLNFTNLKLLPINNKQGRHFLLFKNNSGQEALADIQAVVDHLKPFITTTTQAIEIFMNSYDKL